MNELKKNNMIGKKIEYWYPKKGGGMIKSVGIIRDTVLISQKHTLAQHSGEVYTPQYKTWQEHHYTSVSAYLVEDEHSNGVGLVLPEFVVRLVG
jgi:hypothetical protein